MTDSIRDIVVRLARRELEAAGQTDSAGAAFVELPDGSPEAMRDSSADVADRLQHWPRASDGRHDSFREISSSDPPGPPLRRGGDVGWPFDAGSGDAAGLTAAANPDAGRADMATGAGADWPGMAADGNAGIQTDAMDEAIGESVVAAGTEAGFPSTTDGAGFPSFLSEPDESIDLAPFANGFPPFVRGGQGGSEEPTFAPSSAAGGAESTFEQSINENGRQLEQTLINLEQSLTRLFTAQIETLNRLREQAQEHERRWIEQSAIRRAAFASS